MDGLDTGFFFDLWASTDRAQALWRVITEHDEPAAVSSVTLFEITRHGLVGCLAPSFTETIVGQANVAYEQASIDPTGVLTSPPAEAGRFFAFYTDCREPVGSLVLRPLRELHCIQYRG